MKSANTQAETHSAYVWVFASVVMFGYALLGLFALHVPGVGVIIEFIQSIQTTYIMIAAFTVIFIEGLYIFGSVFPGSSFTLLLAAIAGIQSFEQFILVIVSIFFRVVTLQLDQCVLCQTHLPSRSNHQYYKQKASTLHLISCFSCQS